MPKIILASEVPEHPKIAHEELLESAGFIQWYYDDTYNEVTWRRFDIALTYRYDLLLDLPTLISDIISEVRTCAF